MKMMFLWVGYGNGPFCYTNKDGKKSQKQKKCKRVVSEFLGK